MKHLLLLLIFTSSAFSITVEETNTKLHAPKIWLEKINKLSEDGKNYDAQKTLNFAPVVLEVAEDDSLPNELRSDAYNTYAGLIGLVAKAESSPTKGKTAYLCNKEALELDPFNLKAAIGFANALIRVHNHFLSTFAKMSLGISGEKFYQEADEAHTFLDLHPNDPRSSKLKAQLKEF